MFTVLTWLEVGAGIWPGVPDNILIYNMLAIVRRAGRRRRHWNMSDAPFYLNILPIVRHAGPDAGAEQKLFINLSPGLHDLWVK